MFKKLASDALGLSDVGSVIHPSDYDKVDADDYILHEDNEKIYFLIKSKTDEYCFTNKALVHLDGTSAISKKRSLKRYSYKEHAISDVSMETAGTIDLDVEIKFSMGSVPFSIDIHKNHIEAIKDLYKALIRISELTQENEISLEFAKESLQITSNTLVRASIEGDVSEHFRNINDQVFNWLMNSRKKYNVKDFGFVFEKYINN